jgi:hypothetical protein
MASLAQSAEPLSLCFFTLAYDINPKGFVPIHWDRSRLNVCYERVKECQWLPFVLVLMALVGLVV